MDIPHILDGFTTFSVVRIVFFFPHYNIIFYRRQGCSFAFLIFTNLHAQRTPSQLGTEFSFSKSDAFGLRYNTQYIHQAPPQARRLNRKCGNKSLPFSVY